MNMFIHVDRARRLRVGDIIRKEPYFNESPLIIFSPFIDEGFMAHLQEICRDGLSLHGASYLIQIQNQVHFGSFTTELYFEYVRYKKYPHRPSRLQSLFAFREWKQAVIFAKGTGGNGKIYELGFEGKFFAGDMNLLKLDYDPAKQMEFACRYWEGKTLETRSDYVPEWEYLIDLPVVIKREVRVSPTDI